MPDGKPKVLTNSLAEGNKLSDYIYLSNNSIQGSFGRSLKTAQGGYLSKLVSTGFAHLKVTDTIDCGTTHHLKVKITKMSYMVLTNPSTIFACPKCKQENKVESLALGNDIMKNRLIEKFPHLNFNKFKAINAKDKSIVICNKHGEFKRSYDSLMNKKCNVGCPKCSNNSYSKPEKEIVEFIKTFYDKKIIENDRNIILNEYTGKYLELDIYLNNIKEIII